jgi:hypothetical protein
MLNVKMARAIVLAALAPALQGCISDPLGPKDVDNIRRGLAAYQAAPNHKAFVWDVDGKYLFSSGKASPQQAREDAVSRCRESRMGACEVGYVDDTVWLDPVKFLTGLNADLAQTRADIDRRYRQSDAGRREQETLAAMAAIGQQMILKQPATPMQAGRAQMADAASASCQAEERRIQQLVNSAGRSGPSICQSGKEMAQIADQVLPFYERCPSYDPRGEMRAWARDTRQKAQQMIQSSCSSPG